MTKKYDAVVLIGRFEPVHNAHIEILRRAAKLTEKIIIIIGSAQQPRTFKNPWTAAERQEMILDAVTHEPELAGRHIVICHNTDTIYNDTAWAARVQELVKSSTDKTNIAIIGHKKDESSFYLDMFPQWELIEQPSIEPLNATDVRDLYFRKDANMNFIAGVVPPVIATRMKGWMQSEHYAQIIKEREFVAAYKKQYEHLPYPPIFVTVDAVVIQSGHVIMIKRRSEPGKGLWALPGGFVNANTDKSLEDAMLRELREETGIKVPLPVLRGNIRGNRVFDAISRSARGRTITHAFKIVLPDGPLPKIKGMDDAEKAKWVPIADVKSEQCFEDHFEVLQHFIGA